MWRASDAFERRVVGSRSSPGNGGSAPKKAARGTTVKASSAPRLPTARGRRVYRSKYYPVPEVFWIAADVKLEMLPELPEGAAGLLLTDVTAALDGDRGDAPEP